MIFYFSGTGNSRHVATSLAQATADKLIHMGEAIVSGQHQWQVGEGESIGFVFPTHAWGPPVEVQRFMSELQIDGYDPSRNYTYVATTCGDDVGGMEQVCRRTLNQLSVDAFFSVQMPNTYVCMVGFGTDSTELEQSKLAAAEPRIAEIAKAVSERRRVVDMHTGGWEWLKSHLARAWFLRYKMSDKAFRVDATRCTHCKLCSQSCPLSNISITAENLPQWQGRCTMCLSCLHRCPAQAIDYGTTSRGKGRYYFKERKQQ